ncbi:unnamed protein product [Pleuronectes platessa]|uniref:Uncharacterized protein n=1 Tax=Pleuronectes platessa TaxID=8262 RepID=A0A9N7YZ33_PLEPL|nr:unnamed protein product [Pleuronectes platessa]
MEEAGLMTYTAASHQVVVKGIPGLAAGRISTGGFPIGLHRSAARLARGLSVTTSLQWAAGEGPSSWICAQDTSSIPGERAYSSPCCLLPVSQTTTTISTTLLLLLQGHLLSCLLPQRHSRGCGVRLVEDGEVVCTPVRSSSSSLSPLSRWHRDTKCEEADYYTTMYSTTASAAETGERRTCSLGNDKREESAH